MTSRNPVVQAMGRLKMGTRRVEARRIVPCDMCGGEGVFAADDSLDGDRCPQCRGTGMA